MEAWRIDAARRDLSNDRCGRGAVAPTARWRVRFRRGRVGLLPRTRVVCGAASGRLRPRRRRERVAARAPSCVPGFWDPRRRPERPDLSRIQTIRFLTDVDYPPFDYTGTDGNPAGFNVDLARLICDEIKISCTIQARPFDTLLDALNDNRGDAVIASIAPTADTRRRADFTDPYYRTPARFVARLDSADRRRAAGAARGQEDRRRCRHRARSLPQGHVHRGARCAPIPMPRRRARRCATRRSICCSATASRWPSGSMARIRQAAAPSAAGRFWKAAFSAKASASRSSATTI